MAPPLAKAMVSVDTVPSKPPSESAYLTDDDKDALRVHGLSAAELVDRDLHERGVTVEKTWNERGKDSVVTLGTVWNRIRGRSTTEAYYDHLKAQYSGGKGYRYPFKYQKPTRQLSELDVELYAESYDIACHNAKRPFLDPFGRKIWKYEDVDVYLSPTSSVPRRLIVMASERTMKDNSGVTWRRTEIKGKVPLALRMAEWALDARIGWFRSTFRVILVALPLQALLAFPGANAPWEMDDLDESYREYTGYHWKWPKHAINPLDARVTDLTRFERPQRVSSKSRLLRPRQLMVYENGQWTLQVDPPRNLQYLFISYHWGSFKGIPRNSAGWDRVDQMAQQLTLAAGFKAYFRDEHCIAKPEAGRDVKTSDINRMCDVIRGSRFVALLLPDDEPRRMIDWGRRLWTLPEGLLAPGDIHAFTYRGSASKGVLYEERSMTRAELTAEFWNDEEDQDDVPVRALAEHYDGTTILGRLELFSSSIAALSVRKTSEYSGADLGYALMGLLHYRIDPDPTDDLFQVIARLSLANDSDRLIERCISLYPSPTDNIRQLLRMLAGKDQYQSHLWDITPRCEVVGVGDEPNTVILNECRAAPIRWKQFPRMMYKRHVGFRKRIAELVVRSGAWWMMAGYSLAFTYAPFFIGFGPNTLSTRWLWFAILLFIGMALILSCFAPQAVRRLFGGEVLESAPHLVAFEGTMPKADLERLMFGSNRNRLCYEPSSTPFAAEARHKYIRQANEPEWIAASQHKETLPGHRIFTLVDTGNLSISIFQAKRPPTVALITGSEGGMLRAVLCSWRFSNDCHYRETVIRVPTSTWDQTRPAAWIKVSLQSQADFLEDGRQPRLGLPPKAVMASSPSGGSPSDGSSLEGLAPPLNSATTTPAPPPRLSEDPARPSTSDASSNVDSTASGKPIVARAKKERTKKERKSAREPNTVGTETTPKKQRPVAPEPLRIVNPYPEPIAQPVREDHKHPLPSLSGTVYYGPPPPSASSEPPPSPRLGDMRISKLRRTSTPKPVPVQSPKSPASTSSHAAKPRRASNEVTSPTESISKAPRPSYEATSPIEKAPKPRRTSYETASPTHSATRRRPVPQSTDRTQVPQSPPNSNHESSPVLDPNARTISKASTGVHPGSSPAVPSPPKPPHGSPRQDQAVQPSMSPAIDAGHGPGNQPEMADNGPAQPLVGTYRPPSPPPQLPPLTYSPPLSSSQEIRSSIKLKPAQPLVSRYSTSQEWRQPPPDSRSGKLPSSDRPDSETRWSWRTEEGFSVVAKHKSGDKTSEHSGVSSAGKVHTHERKKSDMSESHQMADGCGMAYHPILHSTEKESLEYSNLVSPRVDFAANSWEYWNGSEGESEEQRQASGELAR